MARFAVGQPIRTAEPTIAVDAGLPVGRHRFQLEVIDSAGQRSVPAVAVVTIQRLTIPVPPVVPPPLRPPLRPPFNPQGLTRSPDRNKRSKPK